MFEVCDGEPRRVGGTRDHPCCMGLLFVECLLLLWAPTGRRHVEDFGWVSPIVSISGAFHKQITHAKAGYRTKSGSSKNYASLSSLEWPVSYPIWVISDLEWAFQVRIGPLRPKMHPIKYEIGHFGPAMGHLQSGAGTFNTGIELSHEWEGPSSAQKGLRPRLDPQASDEPSG